MKMSVDQALRKARSLSNEEAEALYAEMLARFPVNRRLQQALADLARPKIVKAPAHELDPILALYNQGQLAAALDLAIDLLARFPNSEILSNIAGAICAGLGRYDEAVAHYDHAVALAPDYFEAFNNRGNALNEHERAEEAVASFDQALKLNPDYAEAHMNRGIALRRLDRLDEALTSGNRAVRLKPSCAEAYNNRGNTLMAQGRPADALADFDKAITLKTGFAQAIVNRENALLALQQVG